MGQTPWFKLEPGYKKYMAGQATLPPLVDNSRPGKDRAFILVEGEQLCRLPADCRTKEFRLGRGRTNNQLREHYIYTHKVRAEQICDPRARWTQRDWYYRACNAWYTAISQGETPTHTPRFPADNAEWDQLFDDEGNPKGAYGELGIEELWPGETRTPRLPQPAAQQAEAEALETTTDIVEVDRTQDEDAGTDDGTLLGPDDPLQLEAPAAPLATDDTLRRLLESTGVDFNNGTIQWVHKNGEPWVPGTDSTDIEPQWVPFPNTGQHGH